MKVEPLVPVDSAATAEHRERVGRVGILDLQERADIQESVEQVAIPEQVVQAEQVVRLAPVVYQELAASQDTVE